MIKENESECKVVTFGRGSVGMNLGIHRDPDSKDDQGGSTVVHPRKGLIVFYQQSGKKVGEKVPTKFNTTKEFYDENLLFEFENTKSIDVVIRMLQELREDMIDAQIPELE